MHNAHRNASVTFMAIISAICISSCSFIDTSENDSTSTKCSLSESSCISINKKLDTQNCVCVENTNVPSSQCSLTEASCASINKKLDLNNCICVENTSTPSNQCGLTEASCASINKKLDIRNCVCVENTSQPSNPGISLDKEYYCRSENMTNRFELECTETYCQSIHKILNIDTCFCVDQSSCTLTEADCQSSGKSLNTLNCTCENKSSQISIGDLIFFGHYEQDNDTSNGKEPLAWRVLDKQNDKILVITDLVIEFLKFDRLRYGTGFYDYEKCTLREWLNGYRERFYNPDDYEYKLNSDPLNFYDSAFSDIEKAKILTTTVIQHNNPSYVGYSQGNPTEDKIFLLSIYEAQKYINDFNCMALATDVVRHRAEAGTGITCGNRDNYIDGVTYKNPCTIGWGLRTVGPAGVAGFQISSFRNTCARVDYGVGQGPDFPQGVRPAMWLKIPFE